MRVLMICPELPTAASANTMAAGARQIQSIRELGIEVEVVDMRGIPKLKYLQVMPKIRRLAAKVDLIHAHFGYCGWLGKLAPLFSRSRRPLVISFMGDDLLGTPYNQQGDLEWFSKAMVSWNKSFAKVADAVIVKSQEMADVIAPVKSTVIPNGVDIDTFQPCPRETACQTLKLPTDELLVLFPGNPENPRKGFSLASAAVDVAQRKLNREIRIVPLKGVAADQVAVYMNACQAMLMTSLIEGSPNVVKEAMACNLPVVGVPVGDVEQMLSGVKGNTFCRRDAEEVGLALSTMLADPQRSEGREAIIQRGLDLASVARQVENIYRQVLGLPTAASPSNSCKSLATAELS